MNPNAAVANAGGVTMNGVDAGLTLRPIHGLELYNSVSYDHAVYDQGNTSAGVYYDIKGQQVVNYPKFMYKAMLSYTYHGATAWIDGSYMSARNFTYMGDVKAPEYWILNLGAEYKFGNLGQYIHGADFVQNLALDFTVTNLTNTSYIAAMGDYIGSGQPLSRSQNGYTASGLFVGAPRQFFGSIRVEF